MGNQNLKQSSFLGKIMCCQSCKSEFQSDELRGFADQYITIKNATDPYYGESFALQSLDGGKPFTLVKENLTQQTRMTRIVELSELKKSSDGPSNQNIIFTDIVANIERSGCFKTTYDLYVLHDHIESDLLREFQARLERQQDFSESELKAIMKSCTKGFIRLEEQSYNSVRMDHIYFCGSGKDIKVAHPKLFHHLSNLAVVQDNYSAAEIKHIYLSPEQISALERNDPSFVGGQSSNAFSFGVVMLSMMAMKHLDHLYNYQSCQVDHQEIDNLFHEVHNKFSFPLISMVQDLLKANPAPRLSFRELLTRIESTEPANQFINDLVVNLLGKNQKKEEEEEESQTDAKDVLVENKNIKFPNYISAYLKPRIGLGGEYARLEEDDPITTKHMTESVVANQRLRYTDQKLSRTNMASYIGQTITIEKNNKEPIREGKGLYQHSDGQTYIGSWHKGKMHGFGKLYFSNKQLRYEGEFLNGLFHGSGVEYAESQIWEREEEIDQEYVKIFKGNWIRYEGHYQEDKRCGSGKIFFRKGHWRGNFKEGQPNGEGIFYNYRTEKETKGRWNNGQLIT